METDEKSGFWKENKKLVRRVVSELGGVNDDEDDDDDDDDAETRS